jgi:hypothetical protein
MFNMKKASGGNMGYRLVLYYDKAINNYTVVGFTAHKDEVTGKVTFSPDGAAQVFPNMVDAMKFIIEYPDHDELPKSH